MTRQFRVQRGEPLLNIASYAKGGPRASDRLARETVEQVRRTVNRTPDVLVKILPRSSNDLKAVGKHFDYIGREGALVIEGDGREELSGRSGQAISEDWDLDIIDVRRQVKLTATGRQKPPKLVHKMMLSMPPGTPPQKVLTAARKLAREEFSGNHRYAFVLHTDEPHPHVHLVVKAVSELGVRLNIKKATLRDWRSQFASNLRELGVAANATDRAVRGASRSAMKDGIYRASRRGESSFMRARVEDVGKELVGGTAKAEPGKKALYETRADVLRGWKEMSELLVRSGEQELAGQVIRFANGISQPRTERELVRDQLLAIVNAQGKDVKAIERTR